MACTELSKFPFHLVVSKFWSPSGADNGFGVEKLDVFETRDCKTFFFFLKKATAAKYKLTLPTEVGE